MIRRNSEIRKILLEYGLYNYQLAELLGITEPALSRKLRVELPKEEQERIIALIKEKAGER